jgi:hypothetical protein
VQWRCPSCGDGGTIEGWKGRPNDRSSTAQAPGETATLRLTANEQRLGLRLDLPDATSEAVFLRSKRVGNRLEFTSRSPFEDLEILADQLSDMARHASSRTKESELEQLLSCVERALGREPEPSAEDVVEMVLCDLFGDTLRPAFRPRRPRRPRRRREGAAPCAVQVKVMLKHVRPPVWRRLVLPAELTFAGLHRLLQLAFAWDDNHLHVFRTHDGEISDPERHGDPYDQDERRVRVADVLRDEGDRIVYEYDFGDGWEHEIVVEELLPDGATVPRCLAGRRAAPPEDCGGPPGYARLVRVLSGRSHPQHGETVGWVPGGFDPGKFDPKRLDGVLRAAFSR